MSRLAIVALLALACTPTKGISDDPNTPVATVSVGAVGKQPPPQTTTTPAPPVDRDPPVPAGAMPLGTYSLDKKVGEPCDEKAAAHCGLKARIAFSVVHNQHPVRPKQEKDERPCTPQPTHPPNQFVEGEARAACEAEGRVYVHTDCRLCRIYSSKEAVGVLDEMTDTQLRYAQKMAGLSPEPLLRTSAAWRGALAARPLPAKN